MDNVQGRFLGLQHGTTPAAVNTNKNIKMSSFKSSENIQNKEGGPDRSVSDNQSSSVTLKGLAMKARKILDYNRLCCCNLHLWHQFGAENKKNAFCNLTKANSVYPSCNPEFSFKHKKNICGL